MTAYYSENDKLKAAVLREAIKAGAIAPGDVDERSICDVRAGDLRGYTQCHFFAGGGFWSLAARNAGWPDDRPLWTGSCPCPSFSAAGKGGGFDDPRHLWPAWFRLIRECRPAAVFGEQADDAVGYGWLDLVSTDLEAEAYAVGAMVLGAASVGAPHIRQRLYFAGELADDLDRGRQQLAPRARVCATESGEEGLAIQLGDHGNAGELADDLGERRDGYRGARDGRAGLAHDGFFGGLADQLRLGRGARRLRNGEHDRHIADAGGPVGGFWAGAEWIPCRNPKVPGAVEWRAIERGTFVLAARYPERVAELRLAGDAICVPLATEFLAAYLDLEGGLR